MIIYNDELKRSFIPYGTRLITLTLPHREYVRLLTRMFKEIASFPIGYSDLYANPMPSKMELCSSLEDELEIAKEASTHNMRIIESIALKYFRRNGDKIL